MCSNLPSSLNSWYAARCNSLYLGFWNSGGRDANIFSTSLGYILNPYSLDTNTLISVFSSSILSFFVFLPEIINLPKPTREIDYSSKHINRHLLFLLPSFCSIACKIEERTTAPQSLILEFSHGIRLVYSEIFIVGEDSLVFVNFSEAHTARFQIYERGTYFARPPFSVALAENSNNFFITVIRFCID